MTDGQKNEGSPTSLDTLHSRALVPLPSEIEALIQVAPDVRVLAAARQQAETIKGNPNLSGIEKHHIFAHSEGDDEAHCSIYSFSPPFHPIGTENWRDVLSLLRQRLEADEVVPATAGAVGMVRDEVNSEIRQRETAITKSGGKITNREEVFVSGRGFGFIIESQTEGHICYETVFRYHDGTRLAMTLNQPPGSSTLGSDIGISVAKGGGARLQEIIARPLERELLDRLVAYRQEQAKTIIDEARTASEQDVARRTAELRTSLQVLSPVLASASPKAAEDIARDTLFVTRACASPPENRNVRPGDADRIIFTLTRHPLWAACFPLMGGTIALVLGEREEGDLETTTVFLPSEEAQQALEKVTGLSLRGRQDLGHTQVVAVNYNDQPITQSGDLSLERLAETQAARSLSQLPEPPPVLPGFLQPVEEILKNLPPDLADLLRKEFSQTDFQSSEDICRMILELRIAIKGQELFDKAQARVKARQTLPSLIIREKGKPIAVPPEYQHLVAPGWLCFTKDTYRNIDDARATILGLGVAVPETASSDLLAANVQAVIPLWLIWQDNNPQRSVDEQFLGERETITRQLRSAQLPEEGLVLRRASMSAGKLHCASIADYQQVMEITGVPIVPGVKPSKIETTIDDGAQRVIVVEVEGKEIPQEAGVGRYVHVITSTLDKETAAFTVEEKVIIRKFVEA